MMIQDFPISTRPKNALLAAGYQSEEDLKDLYLEDIKKLSGMGDKGVNELREYLYSKFKITLKRKPKKKMDNFKECRFLVDKFLKHANFINWPKEIKTAGVLLEKYGMETLQKVTPNLRTKSLSFYFCEDGIKYINHFLPNISVSTEGKTQAVEEVEVSQEVVESYSVDSKPKSLKDFFRK